MGEAAEPEPLPRVDAEGAFWRRVRDHKVIQWGLGYLGVALALAQGAELVAAALQWPDAVWRIVVLALIVGFPIALTIAWYHGQRGLQQISAGELSIISVLLLIGAVFFTVALRPNHQPAPVAVEDEQAVVQPLGAASRPNGETGDTRNAPANSVAVMPFANVSSDPEQNSFADGLSSELINSLDRVRGLSVAGAMSSFYFKGKNEPPATIAATLNVANLLNGNVQRSGDRLRVTVELVDVRTNRRLWGENYEGALEDIFAIQDEITKQVAEALQIALGVGDLGRQPGMTRDVAAYEEYLRAGGYFSSFRPEDFVLAIEHYRRAIELDESFVLAWLALANAYLFGAQNVPAQSVAWRQAWLDAIERARAIAPDHPGVLGWDALRSAERGSWREAAVFLQERPPELRAGYGSSIQETVAQGNFLMIVGRSTEAISFLERARTLEPLDPGIALFLGDAYANVGAFPQALAEFDRGVQLESLVDVLHGFAAFTALASGDRATAERHLAAFSDPRATGGSTMRSMARFLDDPATGAAEVRRLLNAESFQDFVTPNILAHWAAYYGDADTALALLRGIPAEGNSQQLAHSLWRTVFRDMRKLPGFKDFVSDLGLVAYWREFGWSDFCRPVGDDDFECE